MPEQLVVPKAQEGKSGAIGLRRIAIVPALNEEASIAAVIAEIRAADPGFEVIVVDDGSTDRTAARRRRPGATCCSLPFNLGIGGAVQTGSSTHWSTGSRSPFRSTPTGSTTPASSRSCSRH